MAIATYSEEFPAGTLVVVSAGPSEGTDHEFDGRTGIVVKHGHYIAIEIDRLPRYWKNPVFISPHNLRHANGQRTQSEVET